MMFQNNRITIFGLGKSGLAAGKKLAALGAKVFGSDSNSKLALSPVNFPIELGEHSERTLDADLIIVSPGVHLDLPVLKEARKRGMPIISEIELASYFLSKPIIAVTGTNGKTTTTTLIGEMLMAGGKKVAVAGNIGEPLVAVDDQDLDFIVAEISSYQLETIDKFHPFISLILNLQPDHLERHQTMKEYARQKAKIFLNQTANEYLIYNLDDQAVVDIARQAKAEKVGFTKKRAEILGLSPAEIKIPGRHNLENALAAAQAAYLCGISRETVAQVLRIFPGVEHRIEYVTTINGVTYYNDSKGTNPDSTIVAIETFPQKGIILIMGGRDKGVDLKPLAEKIKAKVKAVILIGEAAPRFEGSLRSSGFTEIYQAGFSLAKAVGLAKSIAKPSEMVLLSPACASFDMFANYEERGKVFKDLCQKLAN